MAKTVNQCLRLETARLRLRRPTSLPELVKANASSGDLKVTVNVRAPAAKPLSLAERIATPFVLRFQFASAIAESSRNTSEENVLVVVPARSNVEPREVVAVDVKGASVSIGTWFFLLFCVVFEIRTSALVRCFGQKGLARRTSV